MNQNNYSLNIKFALKQTNSTVLTNNCAPAVKMSIFVVQPSPDRQFSGTPVKPDTKSFINLL